MKSRNLTVDIARGFIVLIMPATHVTLYYSTLSVQQGLWGALLRCFAEGAGAQLFMFLLGFSFFLGRPKPLKIIFKRASVIFVLAYALNAAKFVLPAVLGILPVSFFNYYKIPHDIFGVIDLLMVGDIFQFAALSYLVCGILTQIKASWLISIVLAAIIALVSPLIWGHRFNNFLVDYLCKFFNGYPPAVFFPFFPWGAYPLLGFGFGKLFKSMPADEFYHICLTTGVACLFVGLLGIQFEPEAFNKTFYRLGPGGTIFHCGLLLSWIYLCNILAGKFKERKKLVAVFSWCSINITFVYIVQWAVICWLLPVFGFMDLGLLGTLFAALIISLLTFLAVTGAKYFKRKKREMKCNDV